MAAKKKDFTSTAIGIGIAIAVLYVLYKLFFGKKVSAASGYGVSSPNLAGYPGTATYPYSSTASTNSALGSLLQAITKALGGGGKGGGGNSVGATPAASKNTGIQSAAQLKQEQQAIAGFSSQANAASNPELGGYSLNTLPVGYDSSSVDLSGYTIPNVAGPQPFDFGTFGFDPSNAPGFDLGGYVNSSYQDSGGNIETQSVDLGNYTIDSATDISGG